MSQITRILMTCALLGALLTFPTNALASCRTHTYTVNGRMVTCTTCCMGNYCNTNCF